MSNRPIAAAALVCAAMLVVTATPANAAENSPTAANPESLAARRAAVQRNCDEIEALLASLPAEADGGRAPIAAKAEEWSEYQAILRRLKAVYDNHLDPLDKLGVIQRSREELRVESEAWRAFSEPPPYSAKFVDDLWVRLAAKNREVEAERFEQDLVDGLLESARAALEDAGRGLRRLEDDMRSAGGAAIARLNWLHDLGKLRHRYEDARVGMLRSLREAAGETLALRLEQSELLRRQALAASLTSPLSVADRDANLKEIAELQSQLDAAIDQASDAVTAAVRQVESLMAASRGPAADEAKAGGGPESDLRRREISVARTEAESASAVVRMRRMLAQIYTELRQWWHDRYIVENTSDAEKIAHATADIDANLEHVERWRAYIGFEIDAIHRQIDECTQRLADPSIAALERGFLERERHAFRHRETATRHVLTTLDMLDAGLRGSREVLGLRRQSTPWRERVRVAWRTARSAAAAVWNFELIALDDTIVVEGREIVGKRSVTLGKVVQVLLILAIGFGFTKRFANLVQRLLLRRVRSHESTAMLAHRVLMVVLSASLVVVALVMANIPLTIFAFFGGALAIGFGFGAQNIVNNFISGLILLVERPIRLGDIIEIDGVRGHVADVGARSCRIRGFDGIDMLIPNSSILEKNVTNWTLTDREVRYTLSVGIAYGSPVDQALALVTQVAAQNSSVLTSPSPEAYLEDFGTDGLVVRLDFWLDLSMAPNQRRVLSDLRRRIDELFHRHQIVISSPAAIVSLGTPTPLRIEMVDPRPSGDAP